MVVVYPTLSRVSSTSSILEDFLPHLQSEEEDWRQFAYLLDEVPLEKEAVDQGEEKREEWRPEEMYAAVDHEERSEEENREPAVKKRRMEKTEEDEEASTRIKMEQRRREEWEEEARLHQQELEELKQRLLQLGREECGGLRVSRRLQLQAQQERREEEGEIKDQCKRRKEKEDRKRKMHRRHSPSGAGGPAHRALDPSEISLGSPSQLAPRSPKKRRDSERTVGSRKSEASGVVLPGWESIADRVRRSKRASESEESSVRRERRVKLELPPTHVPSPSPPPRHHDQGHHQQQQQLLQPDDDRCGICDKAYNPKKHYLQCTRCHTHHHLRCLGITSERKARKMAVDWVCGGCTAKEGELFCLCRKPYDETFYVGCDSCEDWFHPACVNITQEEAETVGEYICPRCEKKSEEGEDEEEEEEEETRPGGSHREEEMPSHSRGGRTTSMSTTFSNSLLIPRSVNLSRADFPILRTLVETMYREKMAEPFRYPVDTREYPAYPTVVQQPMDLSEMLRKVDRLEYHRIDDLAADFALMLDNARRFNAEGSPIYKHSFVLEAIFDAKLTEAKRAMTAKREKMRKQSECGTVDSCLDIDTDQLIDACVDPSIFESLL